MAERTVLGFRDGSTTEITTDADGTVVRQLDRAGKELEIGGRIVEGTGRDHKEIRREFSDNHNFDRVLRYDFDGLDSAWVVESWTGRISEYGNRDKIVQALNDLGDAALTAEIRQVYGDRNRIMLIAANRRGRALGWRFRQIEGRC